jgi:hypothetical protein
MSKNKTTWCTNFDFGKEDRDIDIISRHENIQASIATLVERMTFYPEVPGSNPLSDNIFPFFFFFFFAF